jgi:hypothetical protein
MAPLTVGEKAYLRQNDWGLYDRRLGKIWSKICQAHMDWHWKKDGRIVVDHKNRRLYALKENTTRDDSDD